MRYYLEEDNRWDIDNQHWYLIPVNKRKEFNEWLGLSAHHVYAGVTPEYAKCIGDNPSSITFLEPEQDR